MEAHVGDGGRNVVKRRAEWKGIDIFVEVLKIYKSLIIFIPIKFISEVNAKVLQGFIRRSCSLQAWSILISLSTDRWLQSPDAVSRHGSLSS